jgi:hypothetical protein
MKSYGCGDTAPRILNLGTDEDDWSASRAGHLTFWETDPRYSLDRKLRGPQSQKGRGSEEKS